MSKKLKNRINEVIMYVVLITIGIIMIYPLIWMFFASFKTNEEIYGSIALLPKSYSFQAFVDGWNAIGGNTYAVFFRNSFLLVLPTTILTVVASTLTAYGFARFNFKGKKAMFALLMSTLMLPNAILIIPRYAIFRDLNVLDGYGPFYLMAAFACYPFFSYMLIQFLRGLPRDLDESAYIDGCGTFKTLTHILLPLLKPALFSAGLFQFLWTYNDYFNSLIYINTVKKYTVSMALRLSLDTESVVIWKNVMAMSCLAVLPVVVLFFFAQKYFVEGIATTGLKG
ncbi:carbohydrate ABC transporter permease [Butyrivibrio sp. INlla21]|uniref:carbohydrate ABC transporter permease n=1 Tax=Butyrivibrio sp. INlla21 TaxID=1520811 RepID=UPI0008E9D1C3|nr:carbohydrate ABC transporter permease [Butyrivibrio sp. INlla21]SFU95547.1 oligogalacturonide transport system permease protein [Butyrivibrio sp. INlla21]